MALPKFAEIRKAVVAVVGVIAEIVASGLLHGNLLHIAQGVVALATAAGVYVAKNAATVK